jgi:serine/threonine-protein kinase
MKFKTPLITLAVGLVLAGAIYAIDASLTRDQAGGDAGPPPAVVVVPSTPSEVVESPTVPGDGSGPAAPDRTVTYAGWVDGRGATLAIVVNNGKALAYVCDGAVVEAWLEGTMTNGLIELSGAAGSLTGTYGGGEVTGEVTAGRRSWDFTIGTVQPPSGAYRSAAGLRDKLDASWVVLPDGTQVGVDRTGGEPMPAGPFDLATLVVTVDGTSVAIVPAQPR